MRYCGCVSNIARNGGGTLERTVDRESWERVMPPCCFKFLIAAKFAAAHTPRRRSDNTGRKTSKSARFADFAAISARPPFNAMFRHDKEDDEDEGNAQKSANAANTAKRHTLSLNFAH
jgi:hypothetical protein